MFEISPAFVDALKNLAEVVALAIIGFLMLRLIVDFILKLINGTTQESTKNREVSQNLTIAINELTIYLQHTDSIQQARSDRNMLMSQDRFDDIEYLLEGVLPDDQKERFLVVQERRRQREVKYTQILGTPNNAQ